MTQRGGTLSGGEQQMLAIGARPRLLMRTSRRSGGPLIARQIFDAIRTLNRPDRRTETRAPWLHHGQRPDQAVGNRKRIAAASGNPRSAYLEGGRRG